jgi:hypothetical protein
VPEARTVGIAGVGQGPATGTRGVSSGRRSRGRRRRAPGASPRGTAARVAR